MSTILQFFVGVSLFMLGSHALAAETHALDGGYEYQTIANGDVTTFVLIINGDKIEFRNKNVASDPLNRIVPAAVEVGAWADFKTALGQNVLPTGIELYKTKLPLRDPSVYDDITIARKTDGNGGTQTLSFYLVRQGQIQPIISNAIPTQAH